MRNGCPTVKSICLLLVLVFLPVLNFVLPHAGAQPRPTHAAKVSRDLLEKTRSAAANQSIPVIVQLNDNADSTVDFDLSKRGSRLKALNRFNARALELPAKTVDEFAARLDVRFVSLDRETIPFGHVTTTTGADALRIT